MFPPYVFTLLSCPPSAYSTPTLTIHAIESLAPIQSLAVPPTRPPSLAPTTSSTASLTSTPTTDPQSQLLARLLTVASSSAQPPLVLLTTTPLTPTVPSEQTLWIVTMRSWESQIEELGQRGEWDAAIRLVRRSSAGGAELPVRSCPSLFLNKLSF